VTDCFDNIIIDVAHKSWIQRRTLHGHVGAVKFFYSASQLCEGRWQWH
jgi:hypothetical protein